MCLLSFVVSISILLIFVQLSFEFWQAFSPKGGAWVNDLFIEVFFINFDGRFNPRVAPRLSFCSSTFLCVLTGVFTQGWRPGYCFLHPTFLWVCNWRFHPRVAFCLSNWSPKKVTVISNGGLNWSLISKCNLVSPAQHSNPVVHSLATLGWQGVL